MAKYGELGWIHVVSLDVGWRRDGVQTRILQAATAGTSIRTQVAVCEMGASHDAAILHRTDMPDAPADPLFFA